MSVGVLLVGLGQIGLGYDLGLDREAHVYTHANAFSRHPYFHLMAAVDQEEQRRQIFAQTYHCPAYTDVETALRHHQPDLLVIAVPTGFHNELLQRVLRMHLPKVVLCEKPLSYDLNEAREMVQACALKGVGLYVNYMRRSDPGVIEIKRRLDKDVVGDSVKGVVWYTKGFLNNGSHFFNLLEYWLGPMLHSQVLHCDRRLGESDIELDVQVTFERGNIVFLSAWEEAFSHYTIELLSPCGRLRYDRGGELIQWQSTRPDPHFPGYTVLADTPETIDSGMDCYQLHVAEQLAASFQGRSCSLCSGAQALVTLESMQTIIGEL